MKNSNSEMAEVLLHLQQITSLLKPPTNFSESFSEKVKNLSAEILLAVTDELMFDLNGQKRVQKETPSAPEPHQETAPLEPTPEQLFYPEYEEEFPVHEEFADSFEETPVVDEPSSEDFPSEILPSEEPQTESSVVVQTSPTSWTIAPAQILCQKQDVVVTTRDGRELAIKLSISPLEVKEGLVPLLVNAEYTKSSYRFTSTFKSGEGESLLVVDIDEHSFLMNGKFENGKFVVSIMTTGRSVENGDTLRINNVSTNRGTAPAQKIELFEDATLWIATNEEQYFGIYNSGEWIDEYNASHDVMIEKNEMFCDLKLTQNASGDWTLSY